MSVFPLTDGGYFEPGYDDVTWATYEVDYDVVRAAGAAFEVLLDYINLHGVRMQAPVIVEPKNGKCTVSFKLAEDSGEMEAALATDEAKRAVLKHKNKEIRRVVVVRYKKVSFAAVRFSWWISVKSVNEQLNRLRALIRERGVKADPERYIVCQFNWPFTWPMFRHNEIRIPIMS